VAEEPASKENETDLPCNDEGFLENNGRLEEVRIFRALSLETIKSPTNASFEAGVHPETVLFFRIPAGGALPDLSRLISLPTKIRSVVVHVEAPGQRTQS